MAYVTKIILMNPAVHQRHDAGRSAPYPGIALLSLQPGAQAINAICSALSRRLCMPAKETSVCIVNDTGKICREMKVPS